MAEICAECGRERVSSGPSYAASPCFVGWYAKDDPYMRSETTRDCELDALVDCKDYTIKLLRGQVSSLEGQLENYDTTTAENHAVEQVVKALNRIIDEGRQVGRFGGESLQALAERLLRLLP